MQNFPRVLLHFFELQLAVPEVKLKHVTKTDPPQATHNFRHSRPPRLLAD